MSVREEMNKTLFVGGIFFECDKEELMSLFTQFGNIVRFDYIPQRRIAFVEYEDFESAAFAIHDLHGLVRGGNTLKVSWARKNEDKEKKQQQQQSDADEADSKAKRNAEENPQTEVTQTKPAEKIVKEIERPDTPVGMEPVNQQIPKPKKKRRPKKIKLEKSNILQSK